MESNYTFRYLSRKPSANESVAVIWENNRVLVTSLIEVTVECDEQCDAVAGFFNGPDTAVDWACDEVCKQFNEKRLKKGTLVTSDQQKKTFSFENIPAGSATDQCLVAWIVKASDHGPWKCFQNLDTQGKIAANLGYNTTVTSALTADIRDAFFEQILSKHKSFSSLELSGLEPIVISRSFLGNLTGDTDPIGTKSAPVAIFPFIPLPGLYMIPKITFISGVDVRRVVMTVMRKGVIVPKYPVGNYIVEATRVLTAASGVKWEATNVPSAVSDDFSLEGSDNRIIVWYQSNATTWSVDANFSWCKYGG